MNRRACAPAQTTGTRPRNPGPGYVGAGVVAGCRTATHRTWKTRTIAHRPRRPSPRCPSRSFVGDNVSYTHHRTKLRDVHGIRLERHACHPVPGYSIRRDYAICPGQSELDPGLVMVGTGDD